MSLKCHVFFPMLSVFSMTSVCYHLPSDRDDPEHPNMFSIPKNEITLGDLKRTFPLPGEYHFRAKIKFENSSFWKDLVDDSQIVPSYAGRVVVKVLRISWQMRAVAPVKEAPTVAKSTTQVDLFTTSPPVVNRVPQQIAELDLFS